MRYCIHWSVASRTRAARSLMAPLVTQYAPVVPRALIVSSPSIKGARFEVSCFFFFLLNCLAFLLSSFLFSFSHFRPFTRCVSHTLVRVFPGWIPRPKFSCSIFLPTEEKSLDTLIGGSSQEETIFHDFQIRSFSIISSCCIYMEFFFLLSV